MEEFKNWREIKDWAKEHGYNNMAERMQLNNAWINSDEFGRSQVAICDAMMEAKTEEEREEIAKVIDEICRGDLELY